MFVQISHEERLLLPPNISDGFLPLSITSIDRLIGSPEDVAPMLKRYKKDECVGPQKVFELHEMLPSKSCDIFTCL